MYHVAGVYQIEQLGLGENLLPQSSTTDLKTAKHPGIYSQLALTPGPHFPGPHFPGPHFQQTVHFILACLVNKTPMCISLVYFIISCGEWPNLALTLT